jgi:hypothetical protein
MHAFGGDRHAPSYTSRLQPHPCVHACMHALSEPHTHACCAMKTSLVGRATPRSRPGCMHSRPAMRRLPRTRGRPPPLPLPPAPIHPFPAPLRPHATRQTPPLPSSPSPTRCPSDPPRRAGPRLAVHRRAESKVWGGSVDGWGAQSEGVWGRGRCHNRGRGPGGRGFRGLPRGTMTAHCSRGG